MYLFKLCVSKISHLLTYLLTCNLCCAVTTYSTNLRKFRDVQSSGPWSGWKSVCHCHFSPRVAVLSQSHFIFCIHCIASIHMSIWVELSWPLSFLPIIQNYPPQPIRNYDYWSLSTYVQHIPIFVSQYFPKCKLSSILCKTCLFDTLSFPNNY